MPGYGRGNGKRSPCLEALLEAAEGIRSLEFPAEVTEDGDLVSALAVAAGEGSRLEFSFIASCGREGLEAAATIEGVDGVLEEAGAAAADILVELLRIPYAYTVTVSMPSRSMILLTYPSYSGRDPAEAVRQYYVFSLAVTQWLMVQAERAKSGASTERFEFPPGEE